MSDFERPIRKRKLPEKPERLIRLDRELTTREKDFDYVYAVRKNEYEDYRIKVTVTRIRNAGQGDYEFVATCSIGGKVHRQFGHKPSDAFAKLSRSISWTTSKLSYERNLSNAGLPVDG